MIFDKQKELQLLESQPEWSGVNLKIEDLQKDLNHWTNKLDENPSEWIAKKISKIEKEINLFENIILFWAENHRKLERVSHSIERQIKVANKGAELMDLIEDLREANKYERQENIILSETFVKLAEAKNLDAEKINKVLLDLRTKTKSYQDWINSKIDKIVNE